MRNLRLACSILFASLTISAFAKNVDSVISEFLKIANYKQAYKRIDANEVNSNALTDDRFQEIETSDFRIVVDTKKMVVSNYKRINLPNKLKKNISEKDAQKIAADFMRKMGIEGYTLRIAQPTERSYFSDTI